MISKPLSHLIYVDVMPGLQCQLVIYSYIYYSILFIHHRLFLLTKLLFAYSVFSSFLVQFYVPMDFLEPYVYQIVRTNYLVYKYPRHHEAIKTAIQLTFRTILVLVTGKLITNTLTCSHY